MAMFLGAGFYFSTISLLVLHRLSSGVLSRLFIFIFFIAIWLYAGLRGDVGQDTLSYVNMYGEYGGIPLEYWFLKMEPVFVSLVWLHKKIFVNVSLFFFLYSGIQALLLYLIYQRLHHKVFFLISYTLIFYFEFHLNILRGGMAFLLFLTSLTEENKRKSVLILTSSILFHVSVVVFIPLYFFVKRFNLRFSIFLTLIVFSFSLLVLSFIGDKFEVYLKGVDFSYEFSTISVVLFVFFVFSSFLSFRLKVDYFSASSYLLLSVFLVPYVDIVYRVLYPSLLILLYFCTKSELFSLKRKRFSFRLPFVLVSVFWFSFSAIFFQFNEGQNRLDTGKGNPEFSYLPYSTFIEATGRN